MLDSEATAKLIGISPRTLMRWRVAGRGPSYSLISTNCVRYSVRDIMAWLRALKVDPAAVNRTDGECADQ
jgi:hypothetical protein